MTTRVTSPDRPQSVADKETAQVGIGCERRKCRAHLAFVTGDEVVTARSEQAFAVLPRRADQRNPAGQRLEDADRRNARQLLRIKASGHMYRGSMTGEDAGNVGIRQPAPVVCAVGSERCQSMFGVADAVDGNRELRSCGGPQKKVHELARAFAIPPVAEPDDAASLVVLSRHWRAKDHDVRCLGPDMYPSA